MRRSLSPDVLEKLRAELGELERQSVNVNGQKLKPSQCYRFEADPAHILFNTNCPEGLKKKIQAILSKYTTFNEGRS
jgi:septum formation topological specificity factor MinE